MEILPSQVCCPDVPRNFVAKAMWRWTRQPQPFRTPANALPNLTHHAPPIVTRPFRSFIPGRLVFRFEVLWRASDDGRVGSCASAVG